MAARQTLVHDAITARAEAHPHAVAAVGVSEPMSYGSLNQASNRLAHLLTARGIGTEDVVALALPRGPELVAAALGVWKAGAAYLCLDGTMPAARLTRQVAAAAVPLVVTAASRAGWWRNTTIDVIDLDAAPLSEQSDEDPVRPVTPANLAYVVFTSGTTGTPKPVAVTHRSLANHVHRMVETFGLARTDRVLQFAGVSFDVFAEEVFPTLVAGGRLVISPDRVLAIPEFESLLARHRVTVANLPASYWAEWVRELEARRSRPPVSLRLLVVGSEPSHAGTLADWRRWSAVPVINAYGTSETTITVAAQTFANTATEAAAILPIGRPIGGVTTRVLDAGLRPVHAGEVGELYVGGAAVARGYLGLPAATAQAFLPDPDGGPGDRLYRTGDLARVDAAGALHLLGRVDDQVQVRGHRVEPGEIAAVLSSSPGIAEAYVQADPANGGPHLMGRDGMAQDHTGRHGDEMRLVAYVVPRDPRRVPQPRELRAYLRTRLPDPMLPHAYVVLEALPRTANGKVDRAVLPAPPRIQRDSAVSLVAPRTDTERWLAEIWADVLGTDVGADDDLFEIGGHSLTFLRAGAAIRKRFGVEMSVKDLIAGRTVAAQARHVQRAATATGGLVRVTTEPDGRRAPLSLQQEQIWFLTRFDPDSIAYHAQTTIRFVGPLDLDRLDRAIDAITRRHAVLRTTYIEVDGRPEQVVHPHEPVRADRVDLTDRPDGDRPALLEELVQRELHLPFDIRRLPLIRWTIVRVAAAEYELIIVEHHLLHDGWSFALLMRELTEFYRATAPEPAPLPFQYHDYARWQRSSLDGPNIHAHLDYWLDRFADLPPTPTLPQDRPRPDVQSFRGDHLRVELPAGLPSALRAFSRAHRVTLFTTMLAGFFALLQRYTGESDLCVGSGFANRQVAGSEGLIGMFVNTVALRADLGDDPTFAALVERMSEVVLDATLHEELPFPLLVQELNPSRETGRNPLTQVLFSVNDAPIPRLDLDGATGTIFERGNGSAKVDLDIVVIPRAESQDSDAEDTDDRITLLWEYVVELFDRSTMQRMVDSYLRLLADAVARPASRLSELALLSPTDLARVTTDWNLAAGAGPAAETVPQAVARQAARTPTAAAVRDGERLLTYGELAERSSRLARTLRGLGARAETVVGVCLGRGADLIVAELGVLFAGAAFLPLDPANPPVRLADQCIDAGAQLVLTDRATAARLPAALRPVVLEDQFGGTPEGDDRPDPRPDSLAYLMSTSGSTGRPKTVMIDHRALANVVSWRVRSSGLGAADRVTLMSAPAFDGSVTDIWPALTVGACVHVPDQDTRMDPERLQAWLLGQRITVADLPTALAERVLVLPWPEQTPLRRLITAGDRLRVRPAAGTPFVVVNEYGPTETTVTTTAGEVEPFGAGHPDIGRPIDGTTAYVLDTHLRPVPPGAPGVLWIGGVGLARGYAGQPRLTGGGFVPDPFAGRPGARLYRTGDRVRHRAGGRLEFLGRQDDQIKLHGYRIEPAEVVAALRSHPAVTAAVVTRRGEAPPQLVAYLVTTGGPPPSRAALRAHLARRLPRYMIPGAYVQLDTLPLTASGKVDVRALPAPMPAAPESHRPATTELEQALTEIWQETLGVPTVGLDDNFFDLGGHSLLVARVQRRLADLGRPLPIVTFFEYPTIQSLSRHLEAGAAGTGADAATARAVARQTGAKRQALRRAAAGAAADTGGQGRR